MTAILFIPAFIFLLVAFSLYDKINKFQYRNYRSDWEKNGKAGGFFWNAPESTFFSGSVARSVRLLSWTFSNEDWMKDEPNIRKIVLFMRLCIFAFWALVIFIFVFVNIAK